tara:strand:+ start:1053 stop:1376 length:324 start_codon:yes stop_codon:yes gene_type:complete
MIDTDIGWDTVKVGETELSDDELNMIVHALWRRSDHFSDLAEDDDYLSRRARMRLRERYEPNPKIMEACRLSILEVEIKEKCRSKSREYRRLSELFFEVYYDRKWGD